jgi:dienelactone hydrolase
MKKSLLNFAAALTYVGVFIPMRMFSASFDAAASGEQFVDFLAKGDFAAAVARYDKAMRAALPEPKLRDTWNLVEAQAGRFKKRTHTRLQKLSGYDLALVTCEFQKANLDTKVVFNSQGEVTGLFFLPSTYNAEAAGPPSYAQTNSFGEKDFTVGTGKWRLPGTLTLPVTKGAIPLPAIVLVHGSGPNDRDETVAGSKPFRDLAWGLATKGVAVLRYEKRTKEYATKLTASDMRSFTVREETIDDALSAAKQLRQIDGIASNRVFVLGHSLGGMVVPRIGQADPQIAGFIIMAGATRQLEDMMVEQTRYILSLKGKMSPEDEENLSDLQSKVAKIKNLTAADTSSGEIILRAPPSYWLNLHQHDPVAEAKLLKQPLLILQGGRDYQVTEVDFAAWKSGLANSKNVSFKFYPKLNHLFVSGDGKSSPEEYERGGHVAEEVINDIADWVLKKN